MKLLYPGHRYLGPGNPINNGKPVDKADEIARDHDIEYEQSKSEFDIHKSDIKAIGRFSLNSTKSGFDLPSAVGATGLALKKAGEYYTGTTLYPFKYNKYAQVLNKGQQLLGGEDWFKEENQEEDDMGKRQRTDEGPMEGTSEVTSTNSGAVNPQAGSSLPGGTGSDVMATIIKNPHIETVKMCFNKTFQMYTGGFQFRQFTIDEFFPGNVFSGVFDSTAKLFATPLACIDPGSLWLYITPSQFNQLPLFSHAKSCGIKVTPLGYRLPFQTNEASAGYANSQTLVQCCSAVGLNTIMNCTLTNYATDPSDPTLISSTLASEPNYEALMYGNVNDPVGAVTGVPKHFNQYTGILQSRNTAAGALTEAPLLTDFIKIQNVNDCKGVPLINFGHEFKNGMLKWPPLQSQRMILNGTAAQGHGRLAEGMVYEIPSQYDAIPLDTQGRITASEQKFDIQSDFTQFYNYTIEKSYWMQNQVGQSQTPDYSPFVHFGCMPVPSNFALAPTETFAGAVIQWQIETCLEVEVNLNSLDSYAQVPYIKGWDPIFNNYTGMPRNQGRVILIDNRRFNAVPNAPALKTVKKIN